MFNELATYTPTDLASFHFSPGGGMCVSYTGSGTMFEATR